jgi:hypothetical protein
VPIGCTTQQARRSETSIPEVRSTGGAAFRDAERNQKLYRMRIGWDKIRANMESAHKLRKAIIVLGVLLSCCPYAFALDPALDVSQYAHTSWRIRDGFPKAPIEAIAQTPDGYLWIGTEAGLFRFDGVRAVPWQPPPDQRLP